MKKLFTRNKDLEVAIDKAQNKIKEVKRNTTQNFFRSSYKEDDNINTEGNGEYGNPVNNQSIPQNNDKEDQDSEIEIGCKE